LIETTSEDRSEGWTAFRPQTSPDDIRRDVDAILASFKLHSVRRFMHQRFWEEETQAAEFAAQIEPDPRLESVAEHSWHVADAVLTLSGHFRFIDEANALRLAILHDKMEIYVGDHDPVGRDGTGRSTHAFNEDRRWIKERAEEAAVDSYLERLRPSLQPSHARVFNEALQGRSVDARFVKAVDKLAALGFVVHKKRGAMLDKHLLFTVRYSEKATEYFPPLEHHYQEMRFRLIRALAKNRHIKVSDVEQLISQARSQLALF
jgi:5'-deoxynucleotidase YfbR-like HD superfamily hydrolase